MKKKSFVINVEQWFDGISHWVRFEKFVVYMPKQYAEPLFGPLAPGEGAEFVLTAKRRKGKK